MLGLYCASFAYAGKGSSAAERSSRLTSEHFATDTMCFVQFQRENGARDKTRHPTLRHIMRPLELRMPLWA